MILGRGVVPLAGSEGVQQPVTVLSIDIVADAGFVGIQDISRGAVL